MIAAPEPRPPCERDARWPRAVRLLLPFVLAGLLWWALLSL